MLFSIAASIALAAPAVAQPLPTFLFKVHDDYHEETLWSSDGTAVGTKPLARFCTVEAGPEVAGAAYFVSSDCRKQTRLWRTDGTSRGVVGLKTILDGELRALEFAVLQDTVVLYAATTSSPPRLWKTDGTIRGTTPIELRGVQPESGVCCLAGWRGAVWFWVFDDTAERPNLRLWKSDGTTHGTTQVAAFPPDQERFRGEECRLVPFGDHLYFSSRRDGTPSELWRTNGTHAGTFAVHDFGHALVQGLTASGDTLYFRRLALDGDQWWSTDGVAGHERLVKQIPARWDQQEQVSAMTGGGTLYFTAFGRQLWRSDGTGPGTSLVKDFGNSSKDDYDDITLLHEHRGVLYFMLGSPNGTSAKALWRTDGTVRGTVMVKRVGEPEVFRKKVRK